LTIGHDPGLFGSSKLILGLLSWHHVQIESF